MTSRGARRRLARALAITALVLTAGCQSATGEGDDPGGASGGSDPSSSPTSSVPVPEPTESLPTFDVAENKVIKTLGASMHPLASYKHLVDYEILQGWNDGQSAVTLLPEVNRAKSLDAMARNWIKRNGGPKVQVRQDDAVAGGKYSAWHVLDTTSDPVEEKHTFGILFLDSAWLIEITIYEEGTPEPLTDEEAEGVIATLLSTFKTDLD